MHGNQRKKWHTLINLVNNKIDFIENGIGLWNQSSYQRGTKKRTDIWVWCKTSYRLYNKLCWISTRGDTTDVNSITCNKGIYCECRWIERFRSWKASDWHFTKCRERRSIGTCKRMVGHWNWQIGTRASRDVEKRRDWLSKKVLPKSSSLYIQTL